MLAYGIDRTSGGITTYAAFLFLSSFVAAGGGVYHTPCTVAVDLASGDLFFLFLGFWGS